MPPFGGFLGMGGDAKVDSEPAGEIYILCNRPRTEKCGWEESSLECPAYPAATTI